jgi:hypothetical protein
MKKVWFLLLLTPLIAISVAYPVNDEEPQKDDRVELYSPHSEIIVSEPLTNNEIDTFTEHSFTYENPMTDDENRGQEATVPEKPKKPTRLEKRIALKNHRAEKKNAIARSKMKDARERSDRPRVTHRNEGQNLTPNPEQIEADAQAEERSSEYQNELQHKPYSGGKKASDGEKKTGQIQRQKKSSAKTYSEAMQRAERQTRSHRPGKRPAE